MGTQYVLQPAKGLLLARERHHPGMRAGSHHGNAEAKARQRIARPDASADVGGARAKHTRFRRVGAARTELHYAAAARFLYDERGFGGDQGLKSERRKKVR